MSEAGLPTIRAPAARPQAPAWSGCPRLPGISGSELAQSAHDQAIRLGAEIVVGTQMVHSWPDEVDGSLTLELVNGEIVKARALIGAMGSQYRRLKADGRVASAVGEGAMAAQLLHGYFAEQAKSANARPPLAE